VAALLFLSALPVRHWRRDDTERSDEDGVMALC